MKRVPSVCGELTYEVAPEDLLDVATTLRDDPELSVDQLIDACGVDYLTYGEDEWKTESATESGFSRGVDREPVILDDSDTFDPRRFAVVYHLMSVKLNYRLRLRVFTGENNPPIVPSAEMTRWHGITIGIGFAPLACPTARAAPGIPIRLASSL